jgi:hypothetical protein
LTHTSYLAFALWNLREFRVADLDGNQLRVFYDFNWEMSEERRLELV